METKVVGYNGTKERLIEILGFIIIGLVSVGILFMSLVILDKLHISFGFILISILPIIISGYQIISIFFKLGRKSKKDSKIEIEQTEYELIYRAYNKDVLVKEIKIPFTQVCAINQNKKPSINRYFHNHNYYIKNKETKPLKISTSYFRSNEIEEFIKILEKRCVLYIK